MNHSILLVVEKPDLSIPENKTKWKNWKDKTASTSMQYTNLEVLSENVVLLTIENSLSALGVTLTCLDDMDYKYALFDTDILWHEVTKGS